MDLVHDEDLEAIARRPVGQRSPGAAARRRRRCSWRRRSPARRRPARPRSRRHGAHRRGRARRSGPVSQLSALARMRALVVLPTPRTPVKRNACATRSCAIALRERARDVLLADQIVERLRAPLAREDEVAHGGGDSNRPRDPYHRSRTCWKTRRDHALRTIRFTRRRTRTAWSSCRVRRWFRQARCRLPSRDLPGRASGRDEEPCRLRRVRSGPSW